MLLWKRIHVQVSSFHPFILPWRGALPSPQRYGQADSLSFLYISASMSLYFSSLWHTTSNLLLDGASSVSKSSEVLHSSVSIKKYICQRRSASQVGVCFQWPVRLNSLQALWRMNLLSLMGASYVPSMVWIQCGNCFSPLQQVANISQSNQKLQVPNSPREDAAWEEGFDTRTLTVVVKSCLMQPRVFRVPGETLTHPLAMTFQAQSDMSVIKIWAFHTHRWMLVEGLSSFHIPSFCFSFLLFFFPLSIFLSVA